MSAFILADCNNFYASCEKLFNPKLEKRPVVVLSNNDGCVIARSEEAKALGIKMGEPYFKIQKLCIQNQVIVCSSNFSLYGDISRRVMNILTENAPEIEIYSIDEAFIKYPSLTNLIETAEHLRKKIKRYVGISVSFGIGPTKTLAKAANYLAKKHKTAVFDLSAKDVREEIFTRYPVKEVWGIGSSLSERLNALSIYTIEDFIHADPFLIKKKFGVVGERLRLELQGVPCFTLEKEAPKKSITCSRSFGEVLTEEADIAEALATFAAKASLKLRNQNSYVKTIDVYLEQTINLPYFQRIQTNATNAFLTPTQDTLEIITAAKKCLRSIYQPNQQYKKCGIVLLDLMLENEIIPDLFLKPVNPKRKALMDTVDQLNEQFGKNNLFFGSMGVNPKWKGRRGFKSSYTTTDWNLLPIVKA